MEDLQIGNRDVSISKKKIASENVGNQIGGKLFGLKNDTRVASISIANETRNTIYALHSGIIETNRQIIRNESGQSKHKPYLGQYEQKPLKDSSLMNFSAKKKSEWLALTAFILVVIFTVLELLIVVF